MDHHCFYEETTGTLLAFDIDLSPAGPFYVHRESNLEDYRASLHLIRSYEPQLLVSSHLGVLRTDIRGAIDRFMAILDQRDERILAALRDQPRTPSGRPDSPNPSHRVDGIVVGFGVAANSVNG